LKELFTKVCKDELLRGKSRGNLSYEIKKRLISFMGVSFFFLGKEKMPASHSENS